TTRSHANGFTSRKVPGVAKGIAPHRQTEKPELRRAYQNPGQKQESKQRRQRPHPGRKSTDQTVANRLVKHL
ncbi:uncharacterized protein METZ01_LOCUS428443, partial [marine metagenome]